VNRKSVLTILALIATALAGPQAAKVAVDTITADSSPIAIVGPKACEVGQLVKLSVTGANPCWLPQTEDCHVDQNDCFISYRVAGSYEVIASTVIDGKTQIAKQIIVVGPASPVPDAPRPEPVARNLSDDVLDWCVEYEPPALTVSKLGANFVAAASTATSIDDLLARISASNRKVDQEGCERLLARIQQHLIDNLGGADFEAHRRAFEEIGTGLNRYSNTHTSRGLWKDAKISQ